VKALSAKLKCGSVILTGEDSSRRKAGAVFYDGKTGCTGEVCTDKLQGEYYGTGDLFASTITAALTLGKDLQSACEAAVKFIELSISETLRHEVTDPRDGVFFEYALTPG